MKKEVNVYLKFLRLKQITAMTTIIIINVPTGTIIATQSMLISFKTTFIIFKFK
jgi:hypothetical protein